MELSLELLLLTDGALDAAIADNQDDAKLGSNAITPGIRKQRLNPV